MNEDNIAVVKADPVPEDMEESCREAADACPVEAIELEG
jgi:ferredoxin